MLRPYSSWLDSRGAGDRCRRAPVPAIGTACYTRPFVPRCLRAAAAPLLSAIAPAGAPAARGRRSRTGRRRLCQGREGGTSSTRRSADPQPGAARGSGGSGDCCRTYGSRPRSRWGRSALPPTRSTRPWRAARYLISGSSILSGRRPTRPRRHCSSGRPCPGHGPGARYRGARRPPIRNANRECPVSHGARAGRWWPPAWTACTPRPSPSS